MCKQVDLIELHILFAVYSLSGVCSKMASGYSIMSFEFFAWYAGVIFLLGIYAIFWQQFLKKIELSKAFANKAVSVIWAMIWGVIFFKESIGIKQLIGAAIIILGIVLYSFSLNQTPENDIQAKEGSNNAE